MLETVLDEDSELRAQLEEMSDDGEWLYDERTPHVPEDHEEAEDWDTKEADAHAAASAAPGSAAAAAAGSSTAPISEEVSWTELEVGEGELAVEHPPWAGIVGSDVCVLHAAFPSAPPLQTSSPFGENLTAATAFSWPSTVA